MRLTRPLPSLALALVLGACGSSDPKIDADAGPPGGGPSTWMGGSFPWQVFDGSIPDVPPSAAGKTYYVDAVNGNDSNDGMTFATAKKTLNSLLKSSTLKAGDTMLIGGGIYRETPDFNHSTGAVGMPITLGSYGHGTGAPIIDGGLQPATWTHYTEQGQTTVWQTSTSSLSKISSSNPVLGIYVNSGTSENALREVAHGQLAKYASDTLPTGENQTDVVDNSNKWYFDAGGKMLYADFGGVLGSGDPNSADISILWSSATNHTSLVIIPTGHDYFSFIGVTIRAGSWDGVYSESSGITFDHCDIKFNGGGGLAFDAPASNPNPVTGNTLIHSRIWMNVLANWPRFNNGYCTGGWPGGLSWYSQSNALGQGNVVYMNGGEGVTLWGTNAGHTSQNNIVRDNIIYDNFSVNMYVDNTQNGRVEQNFIFSHPRDPGLTFDNLLTLSNGYNTDWAKRLTPIAVSLADEPGSASDGHAHLSDMTVVNNIIAGGYAGFLDYDDGTTSPYHGLRNCVIANNTIILTGAAVPGQASYGWRHLFPSANPDNSSNSLVENNLFLVSDPAYLFEQMGQPDTGSGITNDYNLYAGPGMFDLAGAKNENLAAWMGMHSGWDNHSLNEDAMVADPTEFAQSATAKPVYDWAKATPMTGSPAIGAGTMPNGVSADFTGAARSGGAYDIGAVAQH